MIFCSSMDFDTPPGSLTASEFTPESHDGKGRLSPFLLGPGIFSGSFFQLPGGWLGRPGGVGPSNRGTGPKVANPFHFRGFQESKPPGVSKQQVTICGEDEKRSSYPP